MIIYIDIDKTICTSPHLPGCDIRQDGPYNYNKAKPIQKNIDKANKLYEAGHRIVYWTARGKKTNTDWFHITQEQLLRWGVKYHELKMDKPYFDVLIDDKALNTRDWELIP
jgi:hypothetical protein